MRKGMQTVLLETNGLTIEAEVLGSAPLDENRSAITLRSPERVDRGRCCYLRQPSGLAFDCVISNCVAMGDVFVLELRCLGDTSALIAREVTGGNQ
jgi:hypothetical protein